MNVELIQHILLAISVASLFASLTRPYFGLIAYTIIYFLRVGEVYPSLGQIRFELLVGLYVMIRMLVNGIPAGAHLRDNSANKALAAFAIIVFLSVPFAVSVSTSWEWAIYYLKRFIFAFMVLLLITTRARLRGFLWVFCVLTGWVALEPFLNYLRGEAYIAQEVLRISGSTGYFHNPNALANTVAQALPLLCGLALSTRRKLTKGIAGLLGVFLIVTVIMTGSRAGFLGVAVLGLALVWQSRNRARAFVRVAAILVILLVAMGPEYRARHSTTLEFGYSDSSAHSRIMGLRHGISMLIRRPILGVGIGCYPEARRQWYSFGLWAHNHYGQLMGELGLAGVIVWSWLIIATFRNASFVKLLAAGRNEDIGQELVAYANSIQALFIMRLVVGITVHSLYGEVWYVFAALSARLAHITNSELDTAQEYPRSLSGLAQGGRLGNLASNDSREFAFLGTNGRREALRLE